MDTKTKENIFCWNNPAIANDAPQIWSRDLRPAELMLWMDWEKGVDICVESVIQGHCFFSKFKSDVYEACDGPKRDVAETSLEVPKLKNEKIGQFPKSMVLFLKKYTVNKCFNILFFQYQ